MSTLMPSASRRSVVRASLWAAPAVSVVATAPAWAASTGTPVAMARRTPTTASARAFDPGQAQGVSVLVTDPSNGAPVAGRAVTFTLSAPSATWLRLVDAGVAAESVVVLTNAGGVAAAPLVVVGTSGGASAGVVATVVASPGTVQPVAWTFSRAGSGLSPSAAVGATGRFTGAHGGGRAFTWGTETGGQLGVGTTASTAYVPGAVSTTAPSSLAGRQVLAVATGDVHMLALTADGAVHSWGQSSYGQLGNGTEGTSSLVPGAVSVAPGSSLAGRRVVAVAAGSFFSLALASDGTVHAWGRNSDRQLGDGTTDSRLVPVQVLATGGSSLAGRHVVAIAAGNGHCMALDADGNLHSWGRNSSGILGQGTATQGGIGVPALVKSTPGIAAGVAAVAAGTNHTVALAVDGTVHAWGIHSQGQLGTGTTVGVALWEPTPVVTSGASSLTGQRVVAIACGQQGSLAITSDGALHSWGANGSSQLGWGGTTNQGIPGAVAAGSPSSLAGRTIVAASGMRSTSFALAADGTFHSWGSDASGERADGDGVSSGGTPTQVVGIG